MYISLNLEATFKALFTVPGADSEIIYDGVQTLGVWFKTRRIRKKFALLTEKIKIIDGFIKKSKGTELTTGYNKRVTSMCLLLCRRLYQGGLRPSS